MQATWKPHEKHGELTAKGDLPETVFAFPKQRKEPLTDAKHVRNAVARFDQVTDVSDEDRALAFANTKKAANTMMSSFRRRHGAILAYTPNPIARKPRPKPSRPNASAELLNRPPAKPRQRASGSEGTAAAD
jgi:hypothetical protein